MIRIKSDTTSKAYFLIKVIGTPPEHDDTPVKGNANTIAGKAVTLRFRSMQVINAITPQLEYHFEVTMIKDPQEIEKYGY